MIATALCRSTLGLAALGASVSHHALAQSLASTDPATWRTPEYQADWGLEAMHAADAYAAGYTGLGVTVGVVDSGVYRAHPEFADGRIKPLTLTGTFGADGFYFMDWSGNPINRSPRPTSFSGGQPYSVPGAYNAAYNDPHGTHVTGTIGASRDGVGMHGVAFNANVYVTNTQSTDEMTYGANADYAYFKNAYGSLAAAGARAINTSWGNSPPADSYNNIEGLVSSYANFIGKKTYLDALAEVAKKYDPILVFAAGNNSTAHPDTRSVLPYFQSDLERNWVTVGATRRDDQGRSDPSRLVLDIYSVKAGAAKYWYVAAPGGAITSTVPPSAPGDAWTADHWHVDLNKQSGYSTVNGTSMAAPHATGALAVIMQRYPYMTNQQARDVLLTTAYHRNAVDGVPDANPNAPNAIWGWGVIDLNKAMKGPGQFLGPVVANLPTGTSDTWSNDISEDALVQRKQENDAEAAAWPARKADGDRQRTVPALQAAIPTARNTLDAVVKALGRGNQAAILTALKVAGADPVASVILDTFIDGTGYRRYWPLTNYGYARGYVGWRLGSYLAGLTSADYARTAVAVAAEWQAEIPLETTRIASFASIPTRGSLIKTGGGTLTLTGTNSYSGGTTFAGGTLSVSRDASLGAASAPLSFDGGVLQVTGTGFTATDRPITWANGGGGLDIADPANTFTLTQSLTGTGGLAKLGAGTLALSGTNTYAGATTIAAGTLLARGGQAIGDRSAVLVGAGATLALADGETVGSLAGQGRVALGSARLTAGGDNSSTTFAGTLDGTGGLTKAGAGTLTLAGTNTYTGGTTLAGGTLSVSREASLGAASAPLSFDGGVLQVTGTGFTATDRPIAWAAGGGGFDIADPANTFTLTQSLSGPGGLTKLGAGTLTLTGAHGFTGPTIVAAGGLGLTASASLVSPVITLAGTTLTHAGTLAGGLTNAGITLTSGTSEG
ncbi:S8 family peptidase, partial [Methylobacterium sp. WL7]|uniref:S8 family peptidase n=2 Tax=Bacteria TaxID=2 RepID=UPI001AEF0B1C